MSKSMYSSMSVLEERWWNNSRNAASISINLITLFKTTKSHPKSTRIPLHTLKKTQKYKPKNHKKKKWQLKRSVLLLPLKLLCLLKLLSQHSSILRLAEVPCLQRCVNFHYWWWRLTCEREKYIENDKNAVAIIWDDCVSKKAVGHIPLKWSKVAFKFL